MGSALVVAAVKYGLLALLWVFVVLAFRTVRNDLFGARAGGPAAARPVPAAAAPRTPPGRPAPGAKQGRSAARRLVVTEGALTGTTIGLGDTFAGGFVSALVRHRV